MKNALKAAAVTVLIIALVLITGCTSAPVYSGPNSGHFDGERFLNTVPADKGLLDILRFSVSFPFKKKSWPERVELTLRTSPLKNSQSDGIAVTVINHATALIQVDRLNILTDPVYSERVSPFS